MLHTGKYQAFLQDGAYSAFDPSHIAKWGPHEQMHRACSFFWREDASDFELYLGSRLNELLPVTLWYGADQLVRLDEQDFSRLASPKVVAVAPWRDEETNALCARVTRTLPNMRRFFEPLERRV